MDITSTNLETLLKQFASFRKVYAKLCLDSLPQYNFAPSEIDILLFLSNNLSINTAKELGFYLQVSKSLICRSVDSLLKREFIRICEDENDKRIQHLLLNEKSNEVIKVLKTSQIIFQQQILNGISENDLNVVKRVVSVIDENVKQINERSFMK
ncbi:MAG: helix-turn-helix domain-containing protein [Erysipelotrichaceae bacterium]